MGRSAFPLCKYILPFLLEFKKKNLLIAAIISLLQMQNQPNEPPNLLIKHVPHLQASERFQVVLRVRPIQLGERCLNFRKLSEQAISIQSMTTKGAKQFLFSKIYDQRGVHQNSFPHQISDGIVKTIKKGGDLNKDILILSYGMPKSGKTFSILGNEKEPGLFPVLVQTINLEFPQDRINIKESRECPTIWKLKLQKKWSITIVDLSSSEVNPNIHENILTINNIGKSIHKMRDYATLPKQTKDPLMEILRRHFLNMGKIYVIAHINPSKQTIYQNMKALGYVAICYWSVLKAQIINLNTIKAQIMMNSDNEDEQQLEERFYVNKNEERFYGCSIKKHKLKITQILNNKSRRISLEQHIHQIIQMIRKYQYYDYDIVSQFEQHNYSALREIRQMHKVLLNQQNIDISVMLAREMKSSESRRQLRNEFLSLIQQLQSEGLIREPTRMGDLAKQYLQTKNRVHQEKSEPKNSARYQLRMLQKDMSKQSKEIKNAKDNNISSNFEIEKTE